MPTYYASLQYPKELELTDAKGNKVWPPVLAVCFPGGKRQFARSRERVFCDVYEHAMARSSHPTVIQKMVVHEVGYDWGGWYDGVVVVPPDAHMRDALGSAAAKVDEMFRVLNTFAAKPTADGRNGVQAKLRAIIGEIKSDPEQLGIRMVVFNTQDRFFVVDEPDEEGEPGPRFPPLFEMKFSKENPDFFDPAFESDAAAVCVH